jgi:hypothetical protein
MLLQHLLIDTFDAGQHDQRLTNRAMSVRSATVEVTRSGG